MPAEITPTTQQESPLAPVGARFSLGAAYADLPFSDDPPSGIDTRPFVLRVGGRPAPHRAQTLPPARFCPERQIAVSDDERALPIFPVASDRTTVGSKDGNPNPMEDWTPDR